MAWTTTGIITKELKFTIELGATFNIESFGKGAWLNPVFITSMKSYFSNYLMDNRIRVVGTYPNYTVEAVGKFTGSHLVDVYVIDSGEGVNTNTSGTFQTVFNVEKAIKNKKVFELKPSNNWTADLSEINTSFENISFFISFKKINFDMNTCGYYFTFEKTGTKSVKVKMYKKNAAIVSERIFIDYFSTSSKTWTHDGSPFYIITVGSTGCTSEFTLNGVRRPFVYDGGNNLYLYYEPEKNYMTLRAVLAAYPSGVTYRDAVMKIDYLNTTSITDVVSNDFEILLLAVGDM